MNQIPQPSRNTAILPRSVNHPRQNLIHLPDEPAGVLLRCVESSLAKESSSPATQGGRGRRKPCRGLPTKTRNFKIRKGGGSLAWNVARWCSVCMATARSKASAIPFRPPPDHFTSAARRSFQCSLRPPNGGRNRGRCSETALGVFDAVFLSQLATAGEHEFFDVIAVGGLVVVAEQWKSLSFSLVRSARGVSTRESPQGPSPDSLDCTRLSSQPRQASRPRRG